MVLASVPPNSGTVAVEPPSRSTAPAPAFVWMRFTSPISVLAKVSRSDEAATRSPSRTPASAASSPLAKAAGAAMKPPVASARPASWSA